MIGSASVWRSGPRLIFVALHSRLAESRLQGRMSTSSTTPNFQPIFDRALKEYKRKTRKELITDPLAEEIAICDSPEAILTVLRGKANELNQSSNNDERLTKWLTPTVNIVNALSTTLVGGIGVVSAGIFLGYQPVS